MKQSIFLVTCFLSLVLCEDQNSERINVATTSGGVLGHPTIFKVKSFWLNFKGCKSIFYVKSLINLTFSQDPRSNTSVQYTEFTTIPFAKPPIGDLRKVLLQHFKMKKKWYLFLDSLHPNPWNLIMKLLEM